MALLVRDYGLSVVSSGFIQFYQQVSAATVHSFKFLRTVDEIYIGEYGYQSRSYSFAASAAALMYCTVRYET